MACCRLRVLQTPPPGATPFGACRPRVRQMTRTRSAASRHSCDIVYVIQNLCRQAGTGGKLVPDAYLAALAIEHGCEVITADRDFRRFPRAALASSPELGRSALPWVGWWACLL